MAGKFQLALAGSLRVADASANASTEVREPTRAFCRLIMTQKIQAIPTRYKGYFFRSRLEARWAVFFDELKIEWVYEPEGYILSNGVKYLPDFWLPRFCGDGIFVEVKPERMICPKAKQLAMDMDKLVLMACKDPGNRAYEVIGRDGYIGVAMFMAKYLPVGSHSEEYRLFWEPGVEEEDLTVEESFIDIHVINAYNWARAARFETR